ncbi:MAG: fumarylacetoacetate hydrolase family protein [Gammaproteobacteria bacterium]
MKLATKPSTSSRDGELLIVSKDLKTAVSAQAIVPNLQTALDTWHQVSADLYNLYQQLNAGQCQGSFKFEPTQVTSPLPRAYQWADGSAYVNHVELVRKARGAEMPENFWHDPLMYQGGSDRFLAPSDPIPLIDPQWGLDFEAEVAVITNDVPMAITPEQAGKSIVLLMLVNDISLRNLIPAELAKGFGFFQSKPASAFSPVAVTPDELGNAWDGAKINLPLLSYHNNQLVGQPNAGDDMTFDFPTLIAHAAKTRELSAGSIIGSGTVSNRDRSHGYSCIAEKRMLEILENGQPQTPFMQFGDRIRIEMLDASGISIFGAIDQTVVKFNPQ